MGKVAQEIQTLLHGGSDLVEADCQTFPLPFRDKFLDLGNFVALSARVMSVFTRWGENCVGTASSQATSSFSKQPATWKRKCNF